MYLYNSFGSRKGWRARVKVESEPLQRLTTGDPRNELHLLLGLLNEDNVLRARSPDARNSRPTPCVAVNSNFVTQIFLILRRLARARRARDLIAREPKLNVSLTANVRGD